MVVRTAALNFVGFFVALAIVLTLSGCRDRQRSSDSTAPPVAESTPVDETTNSASQGNSTPRPTTSAAQPPPAGTPTAKAGGTQNAGNLPVVVGTPANNPAGLAIQAVILKGNQEQIEAVTRGDPTVMKDTSTASYYAELLKGNQSLIDGGAKVLKLVQIEWGPVTIKNGTSAQATTYESWKTTYSDAQTEVQERDLNIYTLTLANGVWKIQTDAHPNSTSTPGTASASVRRRLTPTPVTTPAGAISPDDQSHNWSGYAATGGKFTSVTGSWIVPHINAPADTTTTNSGDATWVGIGGVSGHDLVQAGTEAQVVGPGDTVYDAWIEILPAASKNVPLAVAPGDSVTVTVTETKPGTWLMVLKNNTTNQDYQTTVPYKSTVSSAEWVEEAPTGGKRVELLDNFGSVRFTASSTVKDGKTVSIAGAGATSIEMIGSNGQVVATPSKLSADGSGFTVTRN